MGSSYDYEGNRMAQEAINWQRQISAQLGSLTATVNAQHESIKTMDRRLFGHLGIVAELRKLTQDNKASVDKLSVSRSRDLGIVTGVSLTVSALVTVAALVLSFVSGIIHFH